MARRRERPIARINPSGKRVWVARWTNRDGKRRSAGTFELRGPCRQERRDAQGRAVCCAQHAIDAAYELEWTPARPDTVAAYAGSWTDRYPRAPRTNTSYQHRVGRTLGIVVEGRPFGEWRIADVRRRHANAILDALLREQGRAATGAQGVLRVLSAMWEDAINDEIAELNPFRGLRVKASDPRVKKPPREIRVFSWEQMWAFARAAASVRSPRRNPRTRSVEPSEIDRWRPVYAEAMVRLLSDCGLRLGELLALERRDVKGAGACDEQGCRFTMPHLHVRQTAHEGVVWSGTKVDHGLAKAGRMVPLPPELEAMLRRLPARIDTRVLIPTPRGKMWRESGCYRDVWRPAQRESGLDVRPHEMRHSWITHLRAAGVDPADLAAAAGHTVWTATTRYTHSLGRSFESMRRAVGQ